MSSKIYITLDVDEKGVSTITKINGIGINDAGFKDALTNLKTLLKADIKKLELKKIF